MIINNQTSAIATLKLISEVGIVIKFSLASQKIGVKKSKNTHIKFENKIMKNIKVI